MMYTVLNIGKAGMNAMQNKMDSTADDLANLNTYGYKKKEISFQELMHNQVNNREVILSGNANNGSINMGSKSGIGTINFHQGTIIPSTGDFHMAIEGNGFFGVRDENGNLMLTRNGGFHINSNNTITDDSGYPLDIQLNIPFNQWDSSKVSISVDGRITQKINGEDVHLGTVVLYNPEILDSMTPLGEGRYMPSPNVALYNSINNREAFGNINQYALEASNVETAKAMADMITTQRAYSINAKAIQTTDDIMQFINNIKR
ncbi:flagellar hook-basal body protein [Wansuia hejianensis]|uniref:Flagellar hook-basal body protein n=1 Tax=Wansuia hejianensis TaxID=2763667 RepID=A0A926ILL9_9FIRM|nr:flagellar hook-basal body protein [Wansuia hejianensis]MBC8590279.1 flagellar hook-basal body protein [Wansuia hejianensis]